MQIGHPRLRPTQPTGSVLLVALLTLFVLSILGSAFLGISLTENNITFNAIYSEGAFTAAEAGAQAGMAQLSANPTTSVQAIPSTTFATTYTYQSGHRADAGPQPLVFRGARSEPGYSAAFGTGYNPAGFAFNSYQINSTGAGPRNAQREVEMLAEYGPVPQ